MHNPIRRLPSVRHGSVAYAAGPKTRSDPQTLGMPNIDLEADRVGV